MKNLLITVVFLLNGPLFGSILNGTLKFDHAERMINHAFIYIELQSEFRIIFSRIRIIEL